MNAPSDLEFLLRLLLAAGCGLAIGLERQYRCRTAGLRTNALVAAGACVFVLFGEQTGVGAAPLQITAYVVSGVGFLGGGVILRQGFSVQGLNTAATLWCSAAVGCQAAAGHLVPTLSATFVVLAIHVLLRPLGRLVDRAPTAKDESPVPYVLLVRVRRRQEPRIRAQLLQALGDPAFVLQGLTSTTDGEQPSSNSTVRLRLDLLIEGAAPARLDNLVTRLWLEPGVSEVSWHSENPELAGEDENDERDRRSAEPARARCLNRVPGIAARGHNGGRGVPPVVRAGSTTQD